MATAMLPWQQWVLRLGKLAFTLLLAIELALLCWRIVAPEPLTLMAPSRGGAQLSATTLQGTAQYHLFGVAGEEPLAKVTEQVSAPETRLRLELLGVTKAVNDKDASTAIIAPKGGAGEFYRVGDTVQSNTRLAAVYEDRVILDTNGKLETLKFEVMVNTGVETKKVVSTSTLPVRPRRPGTLRDRFQTVETPGEFVEMVTSEANNDPDGLIRQLGVRSEGSGLGYRVMPGSMLLSLELQPGDIVLSVNGQGLGDPSADQLLLQQVSSEGKARIEVQRGDNRFVINHSLE